MPPEDQVDDEENEAGVDAALEEKPRGSVAKPAETLSIIDAPMRERMVDAFPVSEEELDQILVGYRNFESCGSNTAITFADFHSSLASSSAFLDCLQNVEETLLPESNNLISSALDNVFLIGTGYDDSNHFKFIEAVACLLGRRGASSLLQILHATAATLYGPVLQPDILTSLVHRLILSAHFLKSAKPATIRPTPQAWTSSLQERVQNSEDGVTLSVWTDWVNSIAPQVYQALSTFVHFAIFSPDHPFRPGVQPLQFPKINQESALWRYSYQTVPSSLTLLSPCLGANWTNLYSNDADGFAFSTFQKGLLSYHGATVILLQTEAGDIFGFYTDCPWKESRQWYGHECDSFLFALKPTLQFFGPVGAKKYNMYLNNPLSPRPGELTGVAIGGISEKTPRVHIPPSFEQCKAGAMDGAYGSGPLLSDGELFFNIDVIEVWGISTSLQESADALKAGKAQADIREGNRVKAAKVDRMQFLEDFQSGQYMNSVFAHREQARGRHSFCADDDGKGYFLYENQPSVHDIDQEPATGAK